MCRERMTRQQSTTPANATISESGTDILSADTLTVILDARLVLADGANSWIDGGFGKTRFDGTADARLELGVHPVEAALIWQPRFTNSFVGNFSAAYQHGHDRDENFDVMEGYLTFIPTRSGNTNFALKAGLYWPEISLEHATGGAWSTVYTITPSAINSWVGEEVKVIGAEATLYQTVGAHGFVCHCRRVRLQRHLGHAAVVPRLGAARREVDAVRPVPAADAEPVHDHRAGAGDALDPRDRRSPRVLRTGRMAPLAERGAQRVLLRQPRRARSLHREPAMGLAHTILESRRGGRSRPINAVAGASDDRHDADGIHPATTPPAIGSIRATARPIALLTHRFGEIAVSGRFELFETKERGSRMVPADENEDGWAATLAARIPVMDLLTLFVEALHIDSERGARTTRLGLPAEESQTVVQAALRFRW